MKRKNNQDRTYEECVSALIIDHGFKGSDAIATITGKQVWEVAKKITRRSLRRVLEDYSFPFLVLHTTHQIDVLILGKDRVKIALGFLEMAGSNPRFKSNGELDTSELPITGQERNVLMGRLSRGEFPNPKDNYEVALELDLLLR